MGKTNIIILIVVGVMLISGISYAKYKGLCSGPEGKADWVVSRVSKQLDLDEHQQQQLSGFRDKALNMMHDMRNEKPQQMDQALKLLDAPRFDREQAYQIWEVKHNSIAAAGPQLIDAFAVFSDSLNDDQRKNLQAMITRHHQHRHSRFCCDTPEEAVQE